MKKKYKLNLLIITLTISFLFSFNNITQNTNISKNSGTQIRSSSTILPFIVGVQYGPVDLDPIVAWDSASIDVIDQVVEGLLAYDLSDPSLVLIPRLASAMGTWNSGADEYTVPLRTGVKFHDGTNFNAAAVVAHWDRMEWALNTTGSNSVGVTQVAELYEFPDGTPIVDHVTDNGDNSVTFFLNGPYIPFEALLCFSASFIQSPTYVASLSNTYIDTAIGDIVGTGPFVYDSYDPGVEVLFHAFDGYWKGKANITDLVFKEIGDSTARNNALLDGSIHFLSGPSLSMLNTFKAQPNITVLDYGKKGTVTQYLGMNNNLINRTFREAISYSINYSYIIDELMLGAAVRMRSPIPNGIRYSNTTFDVPILNLTRARLVMQSMGFGVGFNIFDDSEWISQSVSAPFVTFNYTYNIGNNIRESLLILLQDNLGKIGIAVTDAGGTWGDFIYSLYEIGGRTRDYLELYFIGWGPDYNDPSNFINPLFTNRSIASNGAQYNGYLAAIEDGRDPMVLNNNVQLLMEAALAETNPIVREAMYDRIQELLIKRDFPWAWGYVSKLYHAHHVNLTGFQQNAFNKLDFYSCQWEYYVTTEPLSISSPDSFSSWEIDTSHYIYWNLTSAILNVKIELYKDGVFELEIAASTANDEEYLWVIPSGLDNSTLYQIKITDVLNPFTYGYSVYFEINNLYNLIIPLIIGTMYGPVDLDPIIAWDSASINVIDQVVEGLFAYDLSAPDLTIIPRLASGMGTWNTDADEYTVPLRTGVKFHDGTDFNASAVVAHWDRMAWALNTTGTNLLYRTQVAELYEFPDRTPIVDHVTDNGDNTVTFFLNGPYVPFEALLCFSASYIQSPTYIASLSNTYIDTATDIIVGTGPFVYDSYEAGVEVLFHAFDDYWKGKANIVELVFSEIVDANARNAALLSGDIDFLLDPMNSMLQVFNLTTGITLEEGPKDTVTQYLGMNNNNVNRTFREAISYAIDYDFIIDVLRSGNAYRMKSPIPQGIRYSKTTFNVPILDLTHARMLMQSMGFGVGFNISDDTEWEAVTFKTFNYTYNIGNSFREDMLVLLQANLRKIGIAVTDAGGTWGDFIYALYEIGGRTRDDLELYFIGWGPNYNDPSNFINSLFTNRSIASNGADYNGYLAAIEDGRDPMVLNDNVQLLMEAALAETNPVTREALYARIQELLVTRDFPWAWCYVRKIYYAYNSNLTGFQPNALKKLDFYSFQWNGFGLPSNSLSISTPDSSSSWEINTTHDITWTSTGNIADVKIELYWKGTFNATISASTPNYRSYSWTIPSALANSTQYQIKITDVSNSSTYDYCDYFEIYSLPSSADSITVTNPSGIVAWEINTVHTLTWTSTGNIADVKIELYWDGTFDAIISASTINDGLYLWTIPSGLANSTQYQIKITDVSNSSTYDYSDYFEIYTLSSSADSITVTNLSGIIAWETESIHSITWTSTGSISNVQIELYLSGILDSVLTSGTPNNGELSWTIPSGLANSTQYQIKITDLSNPSTYDYSDYFTIYTPTSTPSIPQGIPGYNVYLLYMMIGIISVVLIKKKYKHLKK